MAFQYKVTVISTGFSQDWFRMSRNPQLTLSQHLLTSPSTLGQPALDHQSVESGLIFVDNASNVDRYIMNQTTLCQLLSIECQSRVNGVSMEISNEMLIEGRSRVSVVTQTNTDAFSTHDPIILYRESWGCVRSDFAFLKFYFTERHMTLISCNLLNTFLMLDEFLCFDLQASSVYDH